MKGTTNAWLAGLVLCGPTLGAHIVHEDVGIEVAPVRAGGETGASSGDAVTAATPRPIDLAICLDTSGSMDGLIDAAKQKLWAIVNDLALLEPEPKLRVALLTFGNNGHSEEMGWVKVDVPLTGDLDLVSQHLFALTTNGGEEYVGRVVDRAVRELGWSPSPDALRMIVVAGNESADQDPRILKADACRRAIERGILVNSIYCGDPADAIAPGWREVALLADGQFASIAPDGGSVVVATPFDAELTELSAAINETYLPYGDAGREGCSNQWAQDANAAGLNSEAAAQRAQTKASGLYQCSWDLVDACKQEGFDLESIPTEDLPEPMRTMSPEERLAYVRSMERKRAELQQRIQETGRKRDAWVAEESRKASLDDSRAFDRVLRDAIRRQASAKGFRSLAAPAAPPAGEAEPAQETEAPSPGSPSPEGGSAPLPLAPKEGC